MKKLIFLLSSILFLSSCAMYPVQLSLYGSSVLNNDKNYHSSPVEIYLFQLRAPDRFTSANIFDISHDPKKTLGDDFISKDKVMLSPGMSKVIYFNRKENARYLGVMPVLENPEQSESRAIADISEIIPLVTKEITVTIVNNRVSMRD